MGVAGELPAPMPGEEEIDAELDIEEPEEETPLQATLGRAKR
jgi:hypothetical protein